ncbi:MAG: hypothetical protein PHN57_06170 [Candidatus Omnitrophica bacterium]|nr:hypothetical protein [Candidatus Omnitrophota bacterium]
MLKRYQVLLEDWQEEYVKRIAQKYDLSFSEVIRGLICLEAMLMVQQHYPEYKAKLTGKDVKNTMDKFSKSDRERFHRFMSEAFFEARKAIEFRMMKEKEEETKKETT